MNKFAYASAQSIAEAVNLIGPPKSRLLAGGTDLLTVMKLKIIEADRLVDIKTIPGLDGIRFDNNEGLHLGALATLDNTGADSAVREKYPLLAQAISLAASPQLRNRGTLGGNLNQHSRCQYYRGPF